MMRRMLCILGVFILTGTGFGSILDFVSFEVDFTDSSGSEKAEWSEPDMIAITSEGLGWEGDPASSRDGWLRTGPIALGLSWRAPFAVSIRVTIKPEPEEIVLNNGQTFTPYPGSVYVRYSPDAGNWSSWQLLQAGTREDVPESGSGIHYYGNIQVPYMERSHYDSLLGEYAELDVPWRSDEEAAVRWILEEDPDFFVGEQPFMGYVEFLWEGSFRGSRRMESFTAEITYGMSGLHYAPDDPGIYEERDSARWSYRIGS